MKITETIIKKLKPVDKHTLHSVDGVSALYLKQYRTGRLSWVFRTRKGGAWRVVTMGNHPEMSVDEAKAEALRLNKEGRLPDAMTFGQLLDKWFADQIEPTYKRTANVETYVAKGKQWLGHVQLSALKTAELVAKLQAYGKTSPVAANRCLSNWKLALDYGVQIGALEANPLARTTSKVAGGREKSRDRTLTDDEIRALWSWQGPNASLLRFLLLTGLRISEAQQGRLENDRFVVDATKNGKAHWVAAPPLARQQVEPWPTSPTAVQAWLKRRDAGWTPHDLRRTFATRLAGLGVAPHVVEKCLNHLMQGVMGIYNRHEYTDERIAAAELWARELEKILSSGD